MTPFMLALALTAPLAGEPQAAVTPAAPAPAATAPADEGGPTGRVAPCRRYHMAALTAPVSPAEDS